jgi:hypothetical protein
MAVPLRRRGIFVEFQPMTPEQVERTLQCLLQAQAEFEANVARFSQKTEADFARLSEKTDRMADSLLVLTGIANQTERKVADLTTSLGAMRDGLVGLTGIVGGIEERAARREEHFFQRLEGLIEGSFTTEKKRPGRSRSSGRRRRP